MKHQGAVHITVICDQSGRLFPGPPPPSGVGLHLESVQPQPPPAPLFFSVSEVMSSASFSCLFPPPPPPPPPHFCVQRSGSGAARTAHLHGNRGMFKRGHSAARPSALTGDGVLMSLVPRRCLLGHQEEPLEQRTVLSEEVREPEEDWSEVTWTGQALMQCPRVSRTTVHC